MLEKTLLLPKIPPHSLDAEAAVLASMMKDKRAICKALQNLSEDAFYNIAHRKIYSAILALFKRDISIDLTTLQTELDNKGELYNIGGVAYLTTILNYPSTVANIVEYIRIVNEKALLRGLISAATEIISIAHQPIKDVTEILEKAKELINNILPRRKKNVVMKKIQEIFSRIFYRENKRMEILFERLLEEQYSFLRSIEEILYFSQARNRDDQPF